MYQIHPAPSRPTGKPTHGSPIHEIHPLRPKKHHRRGPWACDECRLRKRKCDGARPCGTCVSINQACSFESRAPIQAPTQRIRMLEEKIKNARALIQHLKLQEKSHQDAGLDGILHELEFGSSSTPSTVSKPRELRLDNMMIGSDQIVKLDPSVQAFFGSSSGFSFIFCILEMFKQQPDEVSSAKEVHAVIMDLFDNTHSQRSIPSSVHPGDNSLPDISITLALLKSLLSRGLTMNTYLQEDEIQKVIDKIYAGDNNDQKSFKALVHAILALGYLYHIPFHHTEGCNAATLEASRQFSLAKDILDLTECNDIVSLQALLAMIDYLISASRLASSRSYIAIACSSIYKLGLHSVLTNREFIGSPEYESRLRIFISILQFDTYVSLVLGVPSFINLKDIDPWFFSLELPTPNRPKTVQGIKMQSSLRYLDLLKTTSLGVAAAYSPGELSHEGETSVEMKNIEEVDRRFKIWMMNANPLLMQMRDKKEYALAKYELELAYYFGQILIYQPFLHYLRKFADGSFPSRSHSQHALACIKIASIVIKRSNTMLKEDGGEGVGGLLLCSASWTSIYSIFLSVLCLTFLVAAHTGTSRPSEAWMQSESGIRILAALRCRNNGAAACMDVLKMLVNRLSHTVNFDCDEIESTTKPLCETPMPETNVMMKDPRLSINNLSTGYMANDPAFPPPPPINQKHTSAVPLSPLLWQDDTLMSGAGDTGLQDGEIPSPRAESIQFDADEILAQANQIPLSYWIDDFAGLD